MEWVELITAPHPLGVEVLRSDLLGDLDELSGRGFLHRGALLQKGVYDVDVAPQIVLLLHVVGKSRQQQTGDLVLHRVVGEIRND